MVIPITLGIGAIYFNRRKADVFREIASTTGLGEN